MMRPRRLPRPPVLVGLRSQACARLASQVRRSAKTSAKPTPPPGGGGPEPRILTFRRMVLTGAVALITAAGAITGARLKMDRDVVEQHRGVRELSVDERIAMLEERRAGLVALRIPVERKLADLKARMAAKGGGRGGEKE